MGALGVNNNPVFRLNVGYEKAKHRLENHEKSLIPVLIINNYSSLFFTARLDSR